MSYIDDVLNRQVSITEFLTTFEAKLREPKYTRLLKQGDEHTANLATLYLLAKAIKENNI